MAPPATEAVTQRATAKPENIKKLAEATPLVEEMKFQTVSRKKLKKSTDSPNKEVTAKMERKSSVDRNKNKNKKLEKIDTKNKKGLQ